MLIEHLNLVIHGCIIVMQGRAGEA